MLFSEALAKLAEGIPMRRINWSAEDGYLVLLPGMLYAWKIVLHPNPNAGNYIFSIEDFKASDWVELKQASGALELEKKEA